MSSLTAFHLFFGETQALQYNRERKPAVGSPHAAWDTGHQGMSIQICSSSLRSRESSPSILLPLSHFLPFFFWFYFHQKQSICSDLSAHPWFMCEATLHSWQQSCARWSESLAAGGYQALLVETSLPVPPLWTLTLVSSQNLATGHLGNLCHLLPV